MAAARGRELRITYGTALASATFGSSVLKFRGVHRMRVDVESFSVTYRILLVSPTKTLFATDSATLETALDLPRQDFKVEVLNPSDQAVLFTLFSASHTGNTGLNIRPEWEKPGSKSDTIVSRLYEVTVSGGRPQNWASQAGLFQGFEYDVDYTPSRRGTLIVRGSYSAIGGTLATATYQAGAGIDARVATIVSALGGSWPLALERYTPGDTDQVVQFRRVYKQLIHNESIGLLDHGDVTDQQLTIERVEAGSQDSPGGGAVPLTTVVANYEAAINADNLTGISDLNDLWIGTLRPWVLQGH